MITFLKPEEGTVKKVRQVGDSFIAKEKLEAGDPVVIDEELNGPQQRILDAIAWFESIGIYRPKRTVVAFIAGYSPSSTGFTIPLGNLRSMGLVDYPNPSQAVALPVLFLE